MPNNLLIEGPEQGAQVFTLNGQQGVDAFPEKRKPHFKGQ